MNVLSKRLALASCVLALLVLCRGVAEELPTAKPEEVGVSSEKVEALSKFMQTLVDDGKIAGGVTMMARHGKVIHLKAVGMADREAGKPMQTDAIFRIASMTKPITSVAVMMLWEQGKIGLDDPVSKYIPEFKNPKVLVSVDPLETRPATREITIRDLLTHTSGLGYNSTEKTGPIYEENGIISGISTSNITLKAMMERLGPLPLRFNPGEKWQYSMSPDVLGRVVEVASCDVSMSGLRVALCTDDGATKPTSETVKAVQRAADSLRVSGATIVEDRPPSMDQAQDIWIYNILPLWLSSIRYYPKEYAKLAKSQLAEKRHFATEGLLEGLEAAIKKSDFGFDRQIELLATLQRYREDMMRFIGKYDVVLSPVTNYPAGPHADPIKPQEDPGEEDWESIKARTGGFCVAYNLTGWPAAVVRAGTSPEGLPIGVQIAAKPWRDDVALAVAGAIEKRLGGWKPPTGL